jgi:hypothetical protein
MNGIGVLSEQREPAVVDGMDRPSQRVFVDVADFEVLEHTAGPSLFDRHVVAL